MQGIARNVSIRRCFGELPGDRGTWITRGIFDLAEDNALTGRAKRFLGKFRVDVPSVGDASEHNDLTGFVVIFCEYHAYVLQFYVLRLKSMLSLAW